MKILHRAVVAAMVPVAVLALSAPTAHAQAAPTDPSEPKLEVKYSCVGGALVVTCRLPDGGWTSVSTRTPVTEDDTTRRCSGGLLRGANIKDGVPVESVCTTGP